MENFFLNPSNLLTTEDTLINFEKPKLHHSSVLLSFEHCYMLGKVYREIIGLDNISHFSINISDKNDDLYILSYNPQIAFNIFKNGTYVFNGSISPSIYKHRKMYAWDETYHPYKKNILINNMERKNNITKGVVLTKKVGDLTLLFSFATKKNGKDFEQSIDERKNHFYSMGDHCFGMLSSITERVIDNHLINPIKQNNKTSNIIYLSNYV